MAQPFHCLSCGRTFSRRRDLWYHQNRRLGCNPVGLPVHVKHFDEEITAVPLNNQQESPQVPVQSQTANAGNARQRPVVEEEIRYKVITDGSQTHDHRLGKCGPFCQVDYQQFIQDWQAQCRFKCSVQGCDVAYVDEANLTTHTLISHSELYNFEWIQQTDP